MAFETITWKGRFGPMELRVGDKTFRPSTISAMLAEALDFEPGSLVVQCTRLYFSKADIQPGPQDARVRPQPVTRGLGA